MLNIGEALYTYIVAPVRVQVRLHKSLVRPQDSARDTWPGTFDGQNASSFVLGDFFACRRVENHRLDPKKGKAGAPRLRGRDAGQRSESMTASLGLKVRLL